MPFSSDVSVNVTLIHAHANERERNVQNEQIFAKINEADEVKH